MLGPLVRAAGRPLVVFTLILTSGCGRDPNIPDLARATGVVTFNGEPLANATVQFASTTSEKGYQPGIGSTNDAGEFRIRTYNRDGAVVGQHKVVVIRPDETSFFIDPQTNKPVPKMDPRWKLPKSLIPVKYTHLEKSGLTADVKSRARNEFVFELQDE